MTYNTIVIGGGLSGLFAAALTAKAGKKVLVLTLGAGSLTIASGTIDLLGYINNKTPLVDPYKALENLPANHPYQKIDSANIQAACNEFQSFVAAAGYPYLGTTEKNNWLITAAGTLKPTCLYPKTMQTNLLKNTNALFVLGIIGLKDYYPELLQKNLTNYLPTAANASCKLIHMANAENRDISVLDVARWLDTIDGRVSFIKQVKEHIPEGSTIIVPPIFGTAPNYDIFDEISRATHCSLVETVTMPPAISGLRLRNLLLQYLNDNNVRIVEKANVTRSEITNKTCTAIFTSGIDRERKYTAEHYLLATGGFYGGGINCTPQGANEPIFSIPVKMPDNIAEWSNPTLFSDKPQPYACAGINVNNTLQPLDDLGNVLLKNVRIIGRNLAGYDYCYEKSGNGVAIASAYKATKLSTGGELN